MKKELSLCAVIIGGSLLIWHAIPPPFEKVEIIEWGVNNGPVIVQQSHCISQVKGQAVTCYLPQPPKCGAIVTILWGYAGQKGEMVMNEVQNVTSEDTHLQPPDCGDQL